MNRPRPAGWEAPVTVAELVDAGPLAGARMYGAGDQPVHQVRIVDELAVFATVAPHTAVVLIGAAAGGGWAVEMAVRRAWEQAAACVIAPSGGPSEGSGQVLAERLGITLVFVDGDPLVTAVRVASAAARPEAARTQLVARCATRLAEAGPSARRVLGVLNAELPGTSVAFLDRYGAHVAGRRAAHPSPAPQPPGSGHTPGVAPGPGSGLGATSAPSAGPGTGRGARPVTGGPSGTGADPGGGSRTGHTGGSGPAHGPRSGDSGAGSRRSSAPAAWEAVPRPGGPGSRTGRAGAEAGPAGDAAGSAATGPGAGAASGSRPAAAGAGGDGGGRGGDEGRQAPERGRDERRQAAQRGGAVLAEVEVTGQEGDVLGRLVASGSSRSAGWPAVVRAVLGLAVAPLAAWAATERLRASRDFALQAALAERLLRAGEPGEPGEEADAAAREAAVALGWPTRGPVTGFLLRPFGEPAQAGSRGPQGADEAAQAQAVVNAVVGQVPVLRRGEGWAGWSALDPGRLAERLRRCVEAMPRPCAAGVGARVSGLDAVGESLLGAEAGAFVAVAGSVVRADRMGPAELLGALPAGALRAPAAVVLRPLLDVDRDGSLLETLTAVLDEGGSLRAAERLGVHRNTVTTRLERIRAAGYDLADPATRLALHLACHLTSAPS
ncbi:PucR family transcriptional regulator [Nonomuraea pusilla]|uniref:PucR C-terminal helix-turn-helix domain-containing protein n=1 Tax=Nonomuraea pusilla TaxID=46177 RepID=A0A1H7UCR4_9ACTN|nr:helix-turn-helix domain-containing protein [Nonomuraea pusilla]SEL94554.1 PucR C-terminal helix-turn-helix domain-containing protein [Nonomuraea pusilla]